MSKPSHLLKSLLLLFVTLFVVFSYTFFHEGGHALAGLLSGGRLAGFSLNFWDLSAHVNLVGNFSRAQQILISAAGAALPLLVWLVLILALPREANLAIESLKAASALVVLNTLLAWIALPALFLAGKAPADDVTSFLRTSGLPPLLVSGLALALYAGGWLLFRSRIPSLREELALFRKPDPEVFTPAVRRSVARMAVLLVLFGLAGFSLNGFRLAASQQADPFLPPAGYRPVRTIDLSGGDHNQEAIYTFTLDRAQVAGIYLLVQDINTSYVDVALAGPGGEHKVILHGEGYRASRDNPHLEELLQPGSYQVILTSKRSPGEIAVYSLK